MKVMGFSKAGNMIKLEDASEPNGYVWYFLSKAVQPFAKNNIVQGDEIEFKHEEIRGEDTITFLSKDGSAPTRPGNATPNAGVATTQTTKTYGKSAEEQESIKKQAVMKLCADAIKTLQGQIPDVATLISSIETMYDKLYAKINQ